MEIVIDIHDTPKNDHERWVLEHGTPLPKGHGRLIDADKAKETMMYEMCGTGYQGTAMRVLDSELYTPTVIEADGAESEDRE